MKRTITDDELVYMYTSAHLTMAEIGAVIGITRQGVLKRLRKLGVTAEQGERVEVACAKCGSMFVAERKRRREHNLGSYNVSYVNSSACGVTVAHDALTVGARFKSLRARLLEGLRSPCLHDSLVAFEEFADHFVVEVLLL